MPEQFFKYHFLLQIIEDCEDRLKTDEEIEQLLNIISSKLPDIDGHDDTVDVGKQKEGDEISS